MLHLQTEHLHLQTEHSKLYLQTEQQVTFTNRA